MVGSNLLKKNFSLELDIPVILKLIVGVFLFIAIGTQGKLDPTPISLVWPSEGVQNWFYLPGALIGGFLRDIFGGAALFIALFFLVFKPVVKMRWIKKTVRIFFNTVLFSFLLSAIVPKTSSIILEYSGGVGYTFNRYMFSETSPFLLILFVLFLIVTYNSDFFSEYKFDMTIPVLLTTVSLGIVIGFLGGYRVLKQYLKMGLNQLSQISKLSKVFLKIQGSGLSFDWKSKIKRGIISIFSFKDESSKKSNQKSFQRKKKIPFEILTQEEKKSKKLFENALKEFEKINYPGNETLIDHLDKRD